MHKYSVSGSSPADDNVFEIPEQPRSVCVSFTQEIESYFGREEERKIESPLIMRSPSEDNVLSPMRRHNENGGERTRSAPVERLLATLESYRSSLRMKDAKLKQTEDELAKARKELAKRSSTG